MSSDILSGIYRVLTSDSEIPEPGIGSEWRRKSFVGYYLFKETRL